MHAELSKPKIGKLQGTSLGLLMISIGKPENVFGFDIAMVAKYFILRLNLKLQAASSILVDCHDTIGDAFTLFGHPDYGFPVHRWCGVHISPVPLQVGVGPVENQEEGLKLLVRSQKRNKVFMRRIAEFLQHLYLLLESPFISRVETFDCKTWVTGLVSLFVSFD